MGGTGTSAGTSSAKASDEFEAFASATQNDAADDFEFADFAAAEPVAALNVRIGPAELLRASRELLPQAQCIHHPCGLCRPGRNSRSKRRL